MQTMEPYVGSNNGALCWSLMLVLIMVSIEDINELVMEEKSTIIVLLR